MLLQVRVRDKVFQPMDNVTVVLTVRTVTNSPLGRQPVDFDERRADHGGRVFERTGFV